MSLTISYLATGTARANVSIPGSFSQRITKEVQIVIPNLANSSTFTFDIYDANGYPRYSIAGLAENANHVVLVERVVKPGYTYGMTANAATGTAANITINPEYY